MTAPDAGDRYLESFGAGLGYFDFARVGPLSRQVIDARAQVTQQFFDPSSAVVDESMAAAPASLAACAAIGGWPASNLVFSPNTSTGLFQIAFALEPTAQRDQVLVSADDFPSNTYPWSRAAAAGRLDPLWLPTGGRVTPDLIAAALTDRVAAVAVSAVDFRSGHRADLSGIRSVIGNRWLVVDGIQGFGAVAADWTAADAVVVGGQKWLRSGWGTGFVAVSDRLAEQWDPLLAGWTGVTDVTRYDGSLHPMLTGAAGLSLTNHSPIDQAGFVAGLELVRSVGVDWISGRIGELAGRLAQELTALGAVVLGNPGRATGSGILPVQLPGQDPGAVHQRLRSAGISSTFHGDRVRLSVHATTTQESIDLLLDALDARHAA